MSYTNSSGRTCYEKHFLLGKTCQVQIFRLQNYKKYLNFQVGTTYVRRCSC